MNDEIKNIIGDNLISIVNFGSEGEDNNILIIVKKIDFDFLNMIKPLMIKQRKKNKPVPLLFTKKELFDAADVFPLEFLDIKQPHTTIFGEGVVDKIKFDKKNVRRQLEFELRSKLIHLRENYIWIKDDKELKQLLSASVPSLMPLFYGLLFLKDIKAPTDLDALFKTVAERYKINLSIMRKIKQLRQDKSKANELNNYVKDLMVLLEQLISIIDKIK